MFPNIKKPTFFNWSNETDGWEDLGYIDGVQQEERTITQIHNFCKSKIKIGKEDGKLFKFCPRCLKKLDEFICKKEIQKKIDEREAKMYAYYKSVFIDGFEGGYPQEYDNELIDLISKKFY